MIALTHMRQPNDIKLAENSPRIDLILGGHDHDVQNETVSNLEIRREMIKVEKLIFCIYGH